MVVPTLFFLYIIVLIILNAFGEKDSSCVTPNKESATCLLITDCPMLNELSKSSNKTAEDFIRQSLCGFEDDIPLVCCGTSFSMSDSLSDRLKNYLQQQQEDHKEELESGIKQTNSLSKQLPDRSICGLERLATDRIVGGTRTRLDEFPWLAALEYIDRRTNETSVRCGGSIINNIYVLTAAHCLSSRTPELFQVRLGEWDADSPQDCVDTTKTDCADPVQEVAVAKTIIHPFYRRATKNHDIGLIRLEKDIKYSDYIRPICLVSLRAPSIAKGTNFSISGWGVTENGTVSNIKLKAQVPWVENKECRGMLKNYPIGLNQICAGGERGVDSCQGDSGGPLMRAYEDQLTGQIQWYQEGIVSWGVGCAGTGPGVYTRLRRYRYWIEDQLE